MRRALLVLVMVACGPRASRPVPTGEVPWASSGIDWSKPPAVAPTPLAVPAVRELTINHVHVLVIENHRLPVVAVAAVMTTAGAREDRASPGVAALTAKMIERSARGDLDVAIASDYASTQLVVRSEDLAHAGTVLADVLRRPNLADDAIVRARTDLVGELEDHRTRPRTIAAQVFDRVVFAGHPYEHPAEGTPGTLAAVTPADVSDFHRRSYQLEGLTLIVAGDVDDGKLSILTAPLADWPKARPDTRPALPQGPYAAKLVIVDLPGADQVVVLVGRRTDPAGAADQLAADVANTVLGGGTGSRLDHRLHDELAVTFGAGSSFWRGRLGSSWTVASSFPIARAGEALHATLAEIDQARTADATADEIARAKDELSRAVAGYFETNAGSIRALQRIVGQGLPASWYATYADRLGRITAAEARTAVQTTWSDLSIVIVGDRAKLAGDLTKLGLPIEQYTP